MSKVGQLNKENIKILADERTNALIIMASKGDMATLHEIIKDMDIMLSQVLVETVVLEIGLNDKLTTGIDWVQRTLLSGSGDSLTAFAGQGGGGTAAAIDPLTRTTASSFGGAANGITYYATFFGLNVDAVIQAAATDSRTRTLASPVILTLDNKEATIEATRDQYFFKGKKYAGSNNDGVYYEDDVEMKSVGITVKVTPRINEKGFVVMKIDEKIQNIAGTQRVNEGDWPIVASRNLSAEVAVQSGQTIVLGGLVQNSTIKSRSKIPLLGDIPLLGRLFRADNDEDNRSEVMVFLTPYVLDSPAELEHYARKRKIAADAGAMWTQGFSSSKLADPPDRGTAQRLLEAGIDPAAPVGVKTIRILSQPQAILDDQTTLTTNAPQADPASETPTRTPAP
jgi:general secretion pathway protein D